MAIEVDDLVAQYGAYYINEGQNLQNVKTLLYTMSDTAGLFQDRPQTSNYFKSSNAIMSSVLQPFQKAFTPKGNLKFKPNAFPLFEVKIDVEIKPDEIEPTWAGFMSGKPDNERANWPIIRYTIEEHIIAKKGEEMENLVSFGGKFVEPTPNVASPAEDTMNGIKEVLIKYNAADRLYMGNGPLAMGNIAADPVDFCTQIEDWVDSMNPELRKRLDFICMADSLAKRYIRGKRKKYGMQTAYLSGMAASDLVTIEDHSQIQVKGLLSHEGSTIIWASPKVNRIRPIWKSQLQNLFKVESAKRVVSIFTDWYEALEFEVPELIVTNDSAELS